MGRALIIVIGVLVAVIAFRRRGAITPLRLTSPKPPPGPSRRPSGPAPTPRQGLRQAWREQVSAFQRATRIATVVILVYMVFVIWREFF